MSDYGYVLSPLCVGTRDSAVNPYRAKAWKDYTFTLPHRTPKPQQTTAPDPQN